MDEAPRPRLPHRHLRLLPLQRAHARHSGRHHCAGHRGRAPRCSAAASSRSARTTAAVLGSARCPLSLPRRARRFPPRSSRRAWMADSVPCAGLFSREMAPLSRLSFARHRVAAPRRTPAHQPRSPAPRRTPPSRLFPSSFRLNALNSWRAPCRRASTQSTRSKLIDPASKKNRPFARSAVDHGTGVRARRHQRNHVPMIARPSRPGSEDHRHRTPPHAPRVRRTHPSKRNEPDRIRSRARPPLRGTSLRC